MVYPTIAPPSSCSFYRGWERRCTANGQQQTMTMKSWKHLQRVLAEILLCSAAVLRRVGRVVPKALLEEKLYGIDEELESNAIPVHVSHLRKKLVDAGAMDPFR